MQIIRDAEFHEEVSFVLFYEHAGNDSNGSGYAFDCDEQGNVLLDRLSDFAKASSLPHCQGNPNLFKTPVVQKRINRWKEPRVGLCSCGCEVELDRFTNTCDGCQADYNSAGQLLAPREQWGEETGESLADILSIDGADPEDLCNGDY